MNSPHVPALMFKLAALGRRQQRMLNVLAKLPWAHVHGRVKLAARILGAWLTMPHGTGPTALASPEGQTFITVLHEHPAGIVSSPRRGRQVCPLPTRIALSNPML